jgi:hypothetical protein
LNIDEALHLQAIISGLGKPQYQELEGLRKLLEYSDLNESHLKGDDRTVWDKLETTEDMGDLIVIKAPMELDFLTKLFMSVILFFKSRGIRRRLLGIFDTVRLIYTP